MKRLGLVGVAVAVALVFAGRAEAISFTVGGGSTVSHYNYGGAETQDGLGIVTNIVAPPSPASFDLNLGDPPYCFDFFEIWTHEGTLEGSNDETHWTITATLDLTPADTAVVFTGVTYASPTGGPHGVVEWDGPITVTAGACTYTAALNDATFNQGSPGSDEFGGKGNDGYDGRAMISVCLEVTECDGGGGVIPEPAGLSLIGLALLAVRRRRT